MTSLFSTAMFIAMAKIAWVFAVVAAGWMSAGVGNRGLTRAARPRGLRESI